MWVYVPRKREREKKNVPESVIRVALKKENVPRLALELAEDKVALNDILLAAVERAGPRAERADEVRLGGDLGLDVVPDVIGVIARERLAARGRRLGRGGVHLLDAVVVVGLDDGRDVEVGEAVPSLEGDFAQHAGDVGLAVRDGVPVADPALGDGGGDLVVAGDLDGVELLVAGAGGEVDGPVGVVKGHEGDGVGGDRKGGGAEDRQNLSELHLDGSRFKIEVRYGGEGG